MRSDRFFIPDMDIYVRIYYAYMYVYVHTVPEEYNMNIIARYTKYIVHEINI